jgi:hypothetical protein
MAGGFSPKQVIINAVLHTPLQLYFGGAATLYAYRYYQTQKTYNYWFGKIEFQRRLERHEI